MKKLTLYTKNYESAYSLWSPIFKEYEATLEPCPGGYRVDVVCNAGDILPITGKDLIEAGYIEHDYKLQPGYVTRSDLYNPDKTYVRAGTKGCYTLMAYRGSTQYCYRKYYLRAEAGGQNGK